MLSTSIDYGVILRCNLRCNSPAAYSNESCFAVAAAGGGGDGGDIAEAVSWRYRVIRSTVQSPPALTVIRRYMLWR